MEKLRRDLEEKMAEVTRIKANLQSSEKVTCQSRKDFYISSLQTSEAYVCLCLPGVGAGEQLDDSSAGREGATYAICEREGSRAVVSAAGSASAAVITSAGAREKHQGARRASGQAEGQGQQLDQAQLYQ